MGFRFRKSFGKGPFRVNISKSGVGYSVGTKGLRYTKKAGGGTRTTASIPGTGISYVTESGSKAKASRATAPKSIPSNAAPVRPIVSNPDTNKAAPVSTNVISRHKYCPKCRQEIPLDAVKCPHCGKRWSNDSDFKLKWWHIALPVFAVLFLIGAIAGGESDDRPIQTEPYTYPEAIVEDTEEPTTKETENEAFSETTRPTLGANLEEIFAGQSSSGTSEQTSYILNTGTHKFHLPSCNDVDDMDPSNKKSYTGSRSDVISQGYEPCGHCCP